MKKILLSSMVSMLLAWQTYAQTNLQAGDLLFVAYQMNAVPNNDRIAFVTLVNIAAGTTVQFTDAKYTTNTPAQCSGGLTWTAPATGIPAGTVVTINNDGGTTDIGTVTGSTFGLSASGDQVLVYTGTAATPKYITAISSNAWVAANTNCGGSLSMLPAALTNGVNAINLSTAPGNTAGNTVNAYYTGSMSGTISQLKAAITNPANWTGTASGTAAQTWPTWNFAGTPDVSTIAFTDQVLSVLEDTGKVTIKLKLTNPKVSQVDLVVKPAPFSTAGGSDFTLTTQTLHFTAGSGSTQTIDIPINNDNINEQDEYVVLSLENASGLTITGAPFTTLYIRDNDRKAPVPNKQLELAYIGSYDPSGTSNASSEIAAYDPASHRLFVISALQNRLDIADFSNPASIKPITSVDMTPYGGITSVAVKNGIVAVAAPNANEQLNGSAVFFTIDGVFQKQVTVGALPDMITFTPDGKKVMTANEGQPSDDYTVDPEGSVSIIDLSNGVKKLKQQDVTTLDFKAFNAQAAQLIAAGVRQGNPVTTLSQNMEPEYITFSADGKTAWVILQESNAFAVIDIKKKKVTDIWPLGKKDHSLPGNGFDASDRGNFAHIANWPVKGLYMPDGIASFTANGTTYIVGANEGDDREYSAFNERVRVSASSYKLDSAKFPNAAMLKNDNNLGRLRVTTASGDTDGDGDFDEIHLIGGRSFSIWNATTKSVVYDSKDDFEQYLSKSPLYGPIFNADNENNTFKSRSSSKGPEPEGLALANIRGKRFAFIGLERQGGVMVYDITDPNNVQFVDYNNPRLLASYGGDNGPEGILYISNTASPDGKYYVVAANEISGTLSIYKLTGPAVEPPLVRVQDAIVKENEDHAKIEICLSSTTNETVKVLWYTRPGSAKPLLDYIPRFGTAVIPAGASCTQVLIPIINNRSHESDEQFYVNLDFPVHAKIEDDQAVVTIVDNDGDNHNGHGQGGKVQVYPNPFRSSFTVDLQSSVEEHARLILTDVSGRQVREQKVKLVYGFNRVTIEGLGKLDAGTYFLRIVSESRCEVIKLIKTDK